MKHSIRCTTSPKPLVILPNDVILGLNDPETLKSKQDEAFRAT